MPPAAPAITPTLVRLPQTRTSDRASSAGILPISPSSGRISTNGVRSEKAAVSGHAMPEMARRGLTVAAISAIRHRLVGYPGQGRWKAGLEVLGGRKADRMQAYASGGWASADKIRRTIAVLYRSGRVPFRQDAGWAQWISSPHRSAQRVKAARAALGPEIELAVDAHGTYTVAGARRFRASWSRTVIWRGSKSRSSPMTRQALRRFAPRFFGADRHGRKRGHPVCLSRPCCQACPRTFFPVPILHFAAGSLEAMRIGTLASAFNLRSGAAFVGGSPVLLRRAACLRGVSGELHRRVFPLAPIR